MSWRRENLDGNGPLCAFFLPSYHCEDSLIAIAKLSPRNPEVAKYSFLHWWPNAQNSSISHLPSSILSSVPAVPNLFGTRDRFHGRQFFHGLGVGDVFRMIQAYYIYCALYFYYSYIVIYNEIIIQLTAATDLTGGGAQAVMRVTGNVCKYRWSFACSPATHLLLRGLVPNRPQTGTSPWPGSWGPLVYTFFSFLFPCIIIPIKNFKQSQTEILQVQYKDFFFPEAFESNLPSCCPIIPKYKQGHSPTQPKYNHQNQDRSIAYYHHLIPRPRSAFASCPSNGLHGQRIQFRITVMSL